jgi:hypothetical protein
MLTFPPPRNYWTVPEHIAPSSHCLDTRHLVSTFLHGRNYCTVPRCIGPSWNPLCTRFNNPACLLEIILKYTDTWVRVWTVYAPDSTILPARNYLTVPRYMSPSVSRSSCRTGKKTGTGWQPDHHLWLPLVFPGPVAGPEKKPGLDRTGPLATGPSVAVACGCSHNRLPVVFNLKIWQTA